MNFSKKNTKKKIKWPIFAINRKKWNWKNTNKNVTRRKTKILALWASFPWAPLGAAGCCPASCQTSVPPPLSGAAGSPPATQRGTAPATCRLGTGIEHPHTKCLSRVFIEPRSKYPSSHPPNFWILDFSYLLKRLVCLDICNRHEILKKTNNYRSHLLRR